jgi:hypothetical protein
MNMEFPVCKVGDPVRIVAPGDPPLGNPRLHGTRATVRETTGYGAVLDAPAAATGTFRAHHSEMRPDVAPRSVAVTMGYSGSFCPGCGSDRMRRAGACEVCDACGLNSGCG